MRAIFYLLFFSVVFVLDQIFAVFKPGTFWLLPPTLIAFAVFSGILEENLFSFVLFAIIADFFSGFTFGILTIGLLICALLIFALKKRFLLEPVAFFPGLLVVLLCAVFFKRDLFVLASYCLTTTLCYLIITASKSTTKIS